MITDKAIQVAVQAIRELIRADQAQKRRITYTCLIQERWKIHGRKQIKRNDRSGDRIIPMRHTHIFMGGNCKTVPITGCNIENATILNKLCGKNCFFQSGQ